MTPGPSTITTIRTNPAYRRWLGWGVLAVAFFLVSLHRLSTAVLAGELAAAFDTSGTELGLLHSSFFYLYALLQVPAGVLADRLGTRRSAAYGTAVMSAGALVFGASPTYALAFAGRTVVGVGASVLFVAVLRYCANWYRPEEFATMTGVTFTVGILGGMAASTPLAVAIDAVGWRPAMVGLGAIGFVAAAGIALFAHDSPQRAGLPAIEGIPAPSAGSLAALRRDTLAAIDERETWLIGLLLFCMTGIGITVFGLWGVPFLVQSYGISVTEASAYVFVGSTGGLIGPVLFGWLSDRLGRRTEFIVLAASAFTVTWALIAVLGTPPLAVVAAIFFVSWVLRGGFPLAFTVVKERHPDGASATVVGLVNGFGWFGAAVFPVVLGAVLDGFWTGRVVDGTRVYTVLGYRVGFAVAVLAGLLATACALQLHVRETRQEDATATPGRSGTDRTSEDGDGREPSGERTD